MLWLASFKSHSKTSRKSTWIYGCPPPTHTPHKVTSHKAATVAPIERYTKQMRKGRTSYWTDPQQRGPDSMTTESQWDAETIYTLFNCSLRCISLFAFSLFSVSGRSHKKASSNSGHINNLDSPSREHYTEDTGKCRNYAQGPMATQVVYFTLEEIR